MNGGSVRQPRPAVLRRRIDHLLRTQDGLIGVDPSQVDHVPGLQFVGRLRARGEPASFDYRRFEVALEKEAAQAGGIRVCRLGRSRVGEQKGRHDEANEQMGAHELLLCEP
jgi:hypothetical protein